MHITLDLWTRTEISDRLPDGIFRECAAVLSASPVLVLHVFSTQTGLWDVKRWRNAFRCFPLLECLEVGNNIGSSLFHALRPKFCPSGSEFICPCPKELGIVLDQWDGTVRAEVIVNTILYVLESCARHGLRLRRLVISGSREVSFYHEYLEQLKKFADIVKIDVCFISGEAEELENYFSRLRELS